MGLCPRAVRARSSFYSLALPQLPEDEIFPGLKHYLSDRILFHTQAPRADARLLV